MTVYGLFLRVTRLARLENVQMAGFLPFGRCVAPLSQRQLHGGGRLGLRRSDNFRTRKVRIRARVVDRSP